MSRILGVFSRFGLKSGRTLNFETKSGTNSFSSDKESIKKAYIRVSKDGSWHIPSSEIAELPEVKEMQRMASLIVRQGKIKQG